jgi:hypothetical protein
MMCNEANLQHERSEAFEYRKKFYPGTGPSSQQAQIGVNIGGGSQA